ncbi:uncharacterized protein LOC109827528 [Asparagus officinalis]|uniref:uncharacterized protein LOC109827528 n=1 Tax=Asparagus officinalis TaxID=4686 RepID=UPI00098E6869|nr:uncharacterized protein LOC109827528 [Asparagus officinalis]
MTSVQGKSFSNQEDQFLCLAWLEISQDPVSGTCQKKDKMWERITAVFHEKVGDRQRSPKSLEYRMDAIKKAAKKFRGCVRQIERLNPSGASEIDILTQARIMYGEDVKEKKGFQFDHVSTILKDAEK